MIGTWIWNIWAFLAGFSLYFFLTFMNGEPLPVLLKSFLSGFLFFLSMYVVRFLLSLAFPKEEWMQLRDRWAEEASAEEASAETAATIPEAGEIPKQPPEPAEQAAASLTAVPGAAPEPAEDAGEEMAQIIRKMMDET